MADELDEAIDAAILSNVAGPKRVRGDMGEVESQSVGDLIKLAEYKRSLRTGNRLFGIRFTKVIPPGGD